MKKIISLLLVSFLMFNVSYGQGKTKEATKVGQKAPKVQNNPKLKKDGTPDMRYKDNKTKEAKPAGPLKKDGTPDMRHKANKADKKK